MEYLEVWFRFLLAREFGRPEHLRVCHCEKFTRTNTFPLPRSVPKKLLQLRCFWSAFNSVVSFWAHVIRIWSCVSR